MFFQQLANGIVMGSAYALIAIGLTMAFGIMQFSNFAHGTIYMLGGYCMYFFSMKAGAPFFVSVGLCMITIGLLGVFFDRFIFRTVYGGPHLRDILISLGLLIFLENMALLLWGSETLSIKGPYTETIIRVLGASLTVQRIVVLIASLVLISALYVFLNYTKTGKAIVAVSQSPRGASLVGIDLSVVYMVTFGISSALAAAAGALLAPLFYVYPTMGSMPLIKAFVVVVLGGMGNVQGAVVGGFIVGIVESLGGGYISSDYKNAFPFLILIAVLLMRPEGIFGRSKTSA